jgi:hypothetical protein
MDLRLSLAGHIVGIFVASAVSAAAQYWRRR